MRLSRRSTTLVATAIFALALIVPASALAAFGAIAINPRTADFGVGYNYSNKHDAKQRAQRECPGRCRIAIWTLNLCGAVVKTDTKFYPAAARTKEKAYEAAERKAHGPSKHVAWECSG